MYAGFDVFDTLLARRISPPTAVFLDVGKRLSAGGQIGVAPQVFATERVAAEHRCYASIGHKTTLRDICHEMAEAVGASDPEALAEAELHLEAELLQPVGPYVDLLNAQRQAGRKIVFISDMYLPSEFLRTLLTRHGIAQEGDRLYVSCEVGAHKSGSGLFRHVLQDLAIGPDAMVFYGNHPGADIRGAKRAGLTAELLPLANPTRFEATLEAATMASDGYTAALAGASRAARLAQGAAAKDHAGLVDVAAGVAAPMLVSFVHWILQRAAAGGLKRLYFLSRDGQVMLDIARRLAAKQQLEIDCRYLYASRTALSRAYETPATQGWYLRDQTETTSAFDILARLAATEPAILEASGLTPERLRAPLSPGDRDHLAAFLSSDEFAALYAPIQKAEQALVGGYLSQNGVFDDVPMGIVDIGWSGTLHELICAAATANGKPPPAGFLFGQTRKSCAFGDHRHAFFFDQNARSGLPNPLPGIDLFFLSEVFCCADHGTVVGFEPQGDTIIAQLEETWAATIRAWSFDRYRATMEAFAEALVPLPDGNPLLARAAIGANLAAFWTAPSRAEAEAWGVFPWDAGMGAEAGSLGLASRHSLTSLARAMLRRGDKVTARMWMAGSVALSPAVVRQAHRVAGPLRDRSRKVLRRLRGRR